MHLEHFDELGSENVKVPIFEEDTPSVMEIEMEELDKWMNSMNRNADYECLPTLEEEKEPNQNNPRSVYLSIYLSIIYQVAPLTLWKHLVSIEQVSTEVGVWRARSVAASHASEQR
nr:transmembrane protein 154 [Odocoileus virginianus texanus]